MVVAEPVDEEEVDVVGPQGRQPLVEHLQHLLGAWGLVLGDQDDLLADLGGLLEPLLEAGLGAVSIGGVERADPAGEGQPEQAVEDPALAQGPGAHLEHGDLDAGLAELPLGEDRRLGGASCASTPEVAPRAAAVASAPAWRNVRRSGLFVSSWDIALDSCQCKL